jgi:hypothetical protein
MQNSEKRVALITGANKGIGGPIGGLFRLYEEVRHQLNIRLDGIAAKIRYTLSFKDGIINKKIPAALVAGFG